MLPKLFVVFGVVASAAPLGRVRLVDKGSVVARQGVSLCEGIPDCIPLSIVNSFDFGDQAVTSPRTQVTILDCEGDLGCLSESTSVHNHHGTITVTDLAIATSTFLVTDGSSLGEGLVADAGAMPTFTTFVTASVTASITTSVTTSIVRSIAASVGATESLAQAIAMIPTPSADLTHTLTSAPAAMVTQTVRGPDTTIEVTILPTDSTVDVTPSTLLPEDSTAPWKDDEVTDLNLVLPLAVAISVALLGMLSWWLYVVIRTHYDPVYAEKCRIKTAKAKEAFFARAQKQEDADAAARAKLKAKREARRARGSLLTRFMRVISFFPDTRISIFRRTQGVLPGPRVPTGEIMNVFPGPGSTVVVGMVDRNGEASSRRSVASFFERLERGHNGRTPSPEPIINDATTDDDVERTARLAATELALTGTIENHVVDRVVAELMEQHAAERERGDSMDSLWGGEGEGIHAVRAAVLTIQND